MNEKKQFLLHEYQAVRTRIDKDIEEIDKHEIFYFTAIAGIYLFVFHFSISEFWAFRIMLLLPVAISIYGLARYKSYRDTIRVNEDYIKQFIEPEFLVNIGFVSFYDRNKTGTLKGARYLLIGSLFVFSTIFAVASWIYPEMVQALIASTEQQS